MAKKKKSEKPVVKAPKAAEPEVVEAEVEVEEPEVEVEVTVEDMGPADNAHPGNPVPYAGDSAALVPLLHRLLDTVNTKTAIPAVQEICSCGASITIADTMPEPDRKRMYNAFLRRHKPCLAGLVSTDED